MQISDGYVTTDGIRLFYRKMGDGPQTVLIPNGIPMLDDLAYLAEGRTLIFYDVRNRGLSDRVDDRSKLADGIHHDVDDLDAVRRHFGANQVDVIGHSYVGMTVILFARKYPLHVSRVVQIGAVAPDSDTKYPPHLTNNDQVLQETFAKLGPLQKERESLDPQEFCRKFWSILGRIYVVNEADAGKIKWARCDCPNEVNFMGPWLEHIMPSIQKLHLTASDLTAVQAAVLVVHGTKDRSAAYGGGRDWAMMLPNARLLTVADAAHAPWIEAPELFFGSVRTFLDGRWPDAAERPHDMAQHATDAANG
jgi:pimeloyl-ACP methyl ester carboxylesterase